MNKEKFYKAMVKRFGYIQEYKLIKKSDFEVLLTIEPKRLKELFDRIPCSHELKETKEEYLSSNSALGLMKSWIEFLMTRRPERRSRLLEE